MEGTNWADWTSAIGSLLAVFVSVGLYAASQRDRKHSDDAVARNAALMVLPKFRAAEKTLTWARGQLDSGVKPHTIGTDEMGNDFGVGYLRHQFDMFEIALPSISQLGAAAPAAQRAFHHFRELSDDLATYADRGIWPDDYINYGGDEWVATYTLLAKTESQMRSAVTQIVKLLQS